MPFYERGKVRIYYEEAGSGFPLMLIAGGGLNSTIARYFKGDHAPFNAMEEFKGEYRCIAADLRNANGGQSSGPLEIDRPWDSYTDDHIGLMDHLGIDRFLVLGYCIGGPFIWNLLKRAPDRVVAAVIQVQMLVSAVATPLPHIKSGKLRALMVTDEKRSAVLPDVPSAPEAGLPKMVMLFWVGFAVPAGTPQPIIERLQKEVVIALAAPDTKKRFADMAVDGVGTTPAQAAKLVDDEIQRWSAVIKAANIKAD